MPKGKIAIIHRDLNLLDTLGGYSRCLGCNALQMIVDKTTAPQQAASFVSDCKPDLVLLAENWQPIQFDYANQTMGKEGEGVKALAEIKKVNSTIPVYMISGGPKYVREATQAGANGYIQMPIKLSDFEKLLSCNL